MPPPTLAPFIPFEPFNAAQSLLDASTIRSQNSQNAARDFLLQQQQAQAPDQNRLLRAQASSAEAGASQAEMQAALPKLVAAGRALDAVQATLDDKGVPAARQRFKERINFLAAQGILPKDFDLGVDHEGMSDEEFASQISGAREQISATLRALSPPQEQAPYTLKPGEVRFDQQNQPVAGVPAGQKESTQQFREGPDFVTRRVVDGVPDMSAQGVVARSPIKESAPQTTVTVGGEKIPPELVKTATELSDKADTLSTQVSDLAQMRDMVANADTGALVPVTLPIKAIFADIGINLDEQLPLMQAIEAQQNQLALRFRNPDSGFGLTGNTSNQDVRFLKATVPGLEKTPQANVAIATILLAKQRREATLAAMKSDYIWNNGTLKGWNEAKREYVDQTPLFSDEEKAKLGSLSIPRVMNDADYRKLPSGTTFIDEKGKQWRKP